ncbi:MAG: hypothetical protein ACTSXD_11985 [Candidatus Heimdallarchaeaceae archaeon]
MAVQRGIPDVQALGGLKDGLGGDKVVGFLGSPNAYVNNAIQAGSITLSSGSVAWAIFGKPFTNTPVVVATYSDLDAPAAVCGSLANTGSVYFIGETASKVVDYIAFGTY